MSLPKYDKTKRRRSFEQLPKGAYVIRIKGAREDGNKNGSGSHLTIAFDIAEGDYAGFYLKQFENDSREDKKWPVDGTYYLTVPTDGCQDYVWSNWNTFFADLEDSNDGYVFNGDPKTLKDKLLGGKFAIEEREYNGSVYGSTRLRWTCVAADVRSGNPGKMPNDKLVKSAVGSPSFASPTGADENGFVSIPDGVDDAELPF